MFLNQQLPYVPVTGQEGWRKAHKRRKKKMARMRREFIEAGIKEEREHAARVRAERKKQRAGVDFQVPSTPPALSPKNQLGDGSPPANVAMFDFVEFRAGEFESGMGKADGKRPSRKKREAAKAAALAKKGRRQRLSVTTVNRSLATALKQLARALSKATKLRGVDDEGEVYRALRQEHAALPVVVQKIQRLVSSIIREAKKQPGASGVSDRRALKRLSKTLARKPRADGVIDSTVSVLTKSTPTIVALYERCVSMLSRAERDSLAFLIRRAGLFQISAELEPSDPLIVCTTVLHLQSEFEMEESSRSLQLPSIDGQGGGGGGTYNHKGLQRRPKTIPQVNQASRSKAPSERPSPTSINNLGARGSRRFSKWEDMVKQRGKKKPTKKKVTSPSSKYDMRRRGAGGAGGGKAAAALTMKRTQKKRTSASVPRRKKEPLLAALPRIPGAGPRRRPRKKGQTDSRLMRALQGPLAATSGYKYGRSETRT